MSKSLIQNSLIGLASLVAAASFSGCETTVVSGGGGIVIDPVVYAWYDMYGHGCSTGAPRPGCNFYWYGSDLVKIMDFEDPYFTYDYYNLVYDYWTFYLNGILYEYDGFAWLSPTGILYDEYGNALNQKKGRGRNVVADAAKQEAKVVESAGKEFAAKYSLSVDKGIQIARSLNQWAKLGKERAKTEKDLAEFTKKVYGVDYAQVKKAILEAQAGEDALLESTVSAAAKNWGTSEENMKDVLKNWYRGQLAL